MAGSTKEAAPLGAVSLSAAFQQLLRENREAALEAISNVLVAEESKRDRVEASEELVPWFRAELGFSELEAFAVVFLDQGRRVVGREVFALGSKTRTVLYPRILFSAALACGATAMVLSHNHPGGSLQPSPQDRELTRRVQQIGESLEVALLDHIIITAESHSSFRQHGWM